jgi:hypothetical protein
MFSSGLVFYGLLVATIRGKLIGIAWIALGLGVLRLVRPHFAAFMVIAIGSAFVLFFRIDMGRRLLVWLVAVAATLMLGVYLLRTAGGVLGLEELSESVFEAAEAAYLRQQELSTQGGSQFSPTDVFGLGVLAAPVTVLLRPFLWEAHNPQALFAAFESLLWLVMWWRRRRVFLERVRHLRGHPWAGFAAGYSVIMIAALTAMGNLGIIARQRVAVLPFLWMLFS